ncbi:MAG: hypothetical protein MJ237_04105 [bacterium]|nr:hypothetical protein [bacterium]
MAKFPQNFFEFIYKSFKDDTANMLIWTGVAGWALSSVAQIIAILVNPKFSDEKKGFLLPQEVADAAVNIASFFLITRVSRKIVLNAFKSGKFASSGVREFLNKNKNIYGDKVGKLDFNLDEVAEKFMPSKVKDEYLSTKSFATTMATIGGGIVASNIITPILRNKVASKAQKSYIEYKHNIEKQQPVKEITEPDVKQIEQPVAITAFKSSCGLRI